MSTQALDGRGGTRERVVGQLREQIVDGRLAPGEPLRVERLMRALGVSNSPLREAFVQLESEGLVEVHANRGATVSPLTWQDAVDLLGLLGLLWDAAFRWTAPVLDADQVARLRRADVDLRLALRGGDVGNGIHAIEQFQDGLLEACWSTELVRSLEAVRPRHRRLLRACRSTEVLRAHAALHGAVLDAAGSSDAAAASAAWRGVCAALEATARSTLPARVPA